MQLTLQSPTTQNLGKIRNDIEKALTGIGFTVDTKNLRAAAANIDDLTKAQKKALSTADNFAEAVALKGVNFASYAIATNAVKNLGLYIASAVTEAIRFEKELSVLAQTVNISVDSAKEYSNEILNISKNYGLAQTKTAELVRVLAQAGLSLKESLKAAESLAKTTLIGTFDNLNKTTEAFIALMSAFDLSVNDATKALETINVVSKAFAVESNDIVDAITRAGGAFKAASGNVEELIALFTSVRSYSRESSETIATGFRAILGRLQRAETVNFFKKRGIELRRLNGEFVGGFEAIKRITEGLEQAGIKSGDVEFANVVEQIGGIYQLSRVVALLDNFKEAQRAMAIANKASAESDIDAAKAKETLAFKIDELRANFSALITEITQTATFKFLTAGLLEVTDVVLSLTRAVKGLLPLLAAFAAVKVVGSLGSLIAGGLKRLPKRGSGSGVIGAATGGLIPGVGNGDTVPAMLTPGEFVIRKSAVKAIGVKNLSSINKYGKGGVVETEQLKAMNPKIQGKSHLMRKINSTSNWQDKDGTYINYEIEEFDPLSSSDKKLVAEYIKGVKLGNPGAKIKGNAFEAMVAKKYRLKTTGDNAYLDFLYGEAKSDPKYGKTLTGDRYLNLLSKTLNSKNSYLKKFTKNKDIVNPSDKEITLYIDKLRNKREDITKMNTGGPVGTDTVPALLTPGEFVVNKRSAEQFGYNNLKKINRYAKGGVVSKIQKFADGGVVAGMSDTNLSIDTGLLQSLNFVGDKLGPLANSFSLLTLQMRLAINFTEFFAQKIKAFGESSAEQAKKTEEITRQLDEARKELAQTTSDLNTKKTKADSEIKQIEAKISSAEASRSTKQLTPKDIFKDLNNVVSNIISQNTAALAFKQSVTSPQPTTSQQAAALAALKKASGSPTQQPQKGSTSSNSATGNVVSPIDPKDQQQLKALIYDVKNKYKYNSKIVEAISKIQSSLPGEIKLQIAAISDLANKLNESSLQEYYIILQNKKLLKEKQEAAAALDLSSKDELALIESNIKSLEGALPKKTSFFSKVGGFAKTAVSSFGPEVASLALAAFTSSLDKASQNALTLSEELQKAGDAAGAEKAARTAAQEEMKSGNMQFYSTVGASIGAVFGPLGLAVGAASGALFGFVNSITNFTDFLGLTSYQDQIDAKAMDAYKNAQISSAEKQVAIAKESFDKFGRTDPSKSLDQLEQSISKYINIFEKSREIFLGRDKGLETSQVAFKDFMDMFSSLAKSAEFAGMSFDEISKKNPKIADGLNRIAVATGNTDWLKSFITEFNVLQNVLKAEAASKASLVEAQIRSVKLQRGINEATEKWSKTLTIQSRSLRSINFSKSGLSYLEKVDLSNFELDNTRSQNFKNALDSVSQAFPGLSETVKSFQNEINAFDMAKFELASRLPTINLGTNQNAVQAQRAELAEQVMAIFEGMNLGDLEENIRSQILGGEDPTELLNKILSDKANALQKPLDLITNVFNNYAEVLKNRVEFEAKQLDQSISIQKAQQSNNKMIADIIADIFGENPIAEYQTALQNRLSNVSKALEGTSLSKMNLSGGKRDIDIIGNAISQNKAKQIEIDAFIATSKTIDEFGNTTTDLMNELGSLQTEANAFKVALEELGNTSQETSAAQKALQKSISDRAKLREVAGDLAFGTRESRSEFLKNMQQARILSFTGNIGNIRESDRQSLKAFLTEFKDLPVFNGLKGDEIIRGVTKNFLLSTGSSPEEVKFIMDEMIPIEKQMLEQLKKDSQTQIDQLKALERIEAQSFNAANMNGGGSVFKPRGSDTVPAMLTPGEFVMSKSAVGKIGRANLERMNSTGTIYASDGGIIEVAGVKYDKRTDYFRNRYKSDVAFKQGVDLVESINLRERRKIGYAKNLGIDTANLDLNDPRLAFDQNLVNDTISSIRQKSGEIRSGNQVAIFDQYKGMTGGPLGLPNALRYAAKTVKNVASGYSINQSDELLMQEIFGAPEKLSQKLIDDTINEISASRKGLNVRPLSEAEIFAIKQRFQYTGSPTSTAKQVKQEVVQPKEFDTKSNISGVLNAYGAMAKSFLNPDQRSVEQQVEETFRKKREEERSQKAAASTPVVKPRQNVLAEQNVQSAQTAQTELSKLDRIAERLKTERNPNVRRQLMIGYQYQQRKQQLIDRSNSMYGISQARKAERDKKEAIKREFDRKRGAESLSKMSANPYYKGTKAYAARISAEKDAREKAYDANKIKDIQEYNLPQLSTNTSDETVNNLNKIIQKGNEQKIKEADELVKSYGYGSKNFDPIKMKEAIRNRRKMIESFREKPQGRSPQSIFGRMKENKNREDIVPAMLTPGEFVLKKSAVRDIGLPALNNMNKSKVKGFANGGLVGSGSTGGFNGGGSNSNDYSVLTQSLIDFNSRFSESVRQLVEMPKVFEISLQNVGVNVNLNGAEFLAKLPDVLKSIVLENIQSEIGNITSQVKKNLSSGN